MRFLAIPLIAIGLTGCGDIGHTRAQVEHDHPYWKPTATIPASPAMPDSVEIRKYTDRFVEKDPVTGDRQWVLVEHLIAIDGAGVVTAYGNRDLATAPFVSAYWPSWAK